MHRESGGSYGALRIKAELAYGRDIVASHNAIAHIMRELGLRGTPTRRLPRGARLRRPAGSDLVARMFRRERPNELWIADITEHPTREGKLYCAVVLDIEAEVPVMLRRRHQASGPVAGGRAWG